MQPIGDFLPDILKKRSIDKPVRAAQVADVFRERGESVLGAELMRCVKVGSFVNGVLYLSVLHSSASQELQFKKIALLGMLNTFANEEVANVVFRLGQAEREG